MLKTSLFTGSSELIGSEVCMHFSHEPGYHIHDADNSQRAMFFGPQGDTPWNLQRLQQILIPLLCKREWHWRPYLSLPRLTQATWALLVWRHHEIPGANHQGDLRLTGKVALQSGDFRFSEFQTSGYRHIDLVK